MEKRKNNGITLIALVVTIVILLVLAGITINFLFGEEGLIDRTKQARFTYTIRALEEYARTQQVEQYFAEGLSNPDVILNEGEVSQEEKDTIVKEIPTLNESVYIATGETVYDRDLYWLDTKNVLSETPVKQYLIDMDTLQVYQYEGTKFFKKIWHTLDVGVPDDGGGSGGGSGGDTIPDGYMRIHLTYPEDSTDRQWRIGRPGEERTDGDLVWQDYTGDPILVKIDDIKNIWIRYNLKGVEVVEAPKGTLAVDIRVEPTTPNQDKVTVSVYYEEGSTNQKIKVGNGGWRLYTGPFEVTENCTIQATAEKEMQVTDNNGNNLGTTTVKGKDSYKITNIGEEEINENLPAPTIEDIGNQGGTEKTTARVNYPTDQGEITKIYKVNSGLGQTYTGDIAITEWGTEIIAYYYNVAGEKSPEARRTFEDPTKLEVEIFAQPNPTLDETIKQTKIEIEYSQEAENKTYQIDNGPEQNYTGPFTITENCTITAYAKKTGVDTATDVVVIQFKENEEEVTQQLSAPTFSQQDSSDKTSATVTIKYDGRATLTQYSINGGDLQNYTAPIQNLPDGTVVYAYCEDAEGNMADATYTVSIKQDGEEPEEPEEQLQNPTFRQDANTDNTSATVTITYDEKATVRQYSLNGGQLQDYTAPIPNLSDGTIVYAYCEDTDGNSADGTYTVQLNTEPEDPENPEDEFTAPVISPNYLEDNSKVSINIKYDANAVTKQYSINGGDLQNYTAPFEVTENGTVIYAVNTNSEGETKDATYTVDGIIKKLDVEITVSPDTTAEVESVTVTINYDAEATERTYTVNGGNEQNYTGPFEVTENCTIIAEAKAQDAYGQDTKQITNLPNGLAAPVITETKTEEAEGEVANITITYDDRSISNTYSINTGAMQNYSTGFQIRENDTVINAYSVDQFGNTATAQYVVDDLVRYLLIDKEKYYWILLPYPEQSINRQYKYKSDGVWKAYKEDGFILVKSEYEDELIQGGKPIRLEVEEGRYVDFDGHWYILDSDPQQLQEDIYMKWDDPENTTTPKIPLQILAMPAPPETTDQVDVFIIYPETTTSKQYKIDNGTYQDYTGQLNITQNNTTITARTQYSDGSWSEEISYTVTNIDESIAPEGIVDITANPTEPTNQNVTVTITYNPNSSVLKKKYKVGTGSWQYTEENTVTLTIENNTTIYAALENNQGQSSEAVVYNVENIDKTPPSATISMPAQTTPGTAFNATVTLVDNESGVDTANSRWVLTTSAGNLGTDGGTYTGGTFTSTSQTLNLSGQEEGTYYIHVLVADKAGNKQEIISNGILIKEVLVADGTFSNSKGVNTPAIATGMTPIKWDETANSGDGAWVRTTGDDPDWYSYTTTEKKWANMVIDGTFNSDGSLDESATGYGMFVWIPRYAYQISSGYHSNSATGGTINIKFMKGTSNVAADGTTTWDNASGQGNWNLHPGFEYSSTVPGLWVAKFEASHTGCTTTSSTGQTNTDNTTLTLQVKAGVTSWRNITIGNMFTVCQNYNPTLNSHMMKNSEWGAVAYLTQSSYGKNEEVWINNNSSYITGSAGNSASAESNVGTTNDYTSDQGQEASTTGNVYGIYDMSGGAYEYVVAYLNNGHDNLIEYSNSLLNAPIYMKDVYEVGIEDTREANYTENAGKYGDAVYETALADSERGWYGDVSRFLYSNNVIFMRGGGSANIGSAGLFCSQTTRGHNYWAYSFRPVIITPLS